MEHYVDQWKAVVAAHLTALAKGKGLDALRFSPDDIVAETPPKPELGDIGFPMFPYAKAFRMAPAHIALALADMERGTSYEGRDVQDAVARDWPGNIKAVGPYLNVYFDRAHVVEYLLAHSRETSWGSIPAFKGRRVMVEFSCPNTNKPLHLGHLRNNVLGESLSRIMIAAGAEVKKVNLITIVVFISVSRCWPISPMGEHRSPRR